MYAYAYAYAWVHASVHVCVYARMYVSLRKAPTIQTPNCPRHWYQRYKLMLVQGQSQGSGDLVRIVLRVIEFS